MALRLGAATALSLVVEHFVTLDAVRLRSGLDLYWTWGEVRFAVAEALPIGVAMALLVWREGRRRWQATRLPEAALLAVACHVLLVVWILSVRLGWLPVVPPLLEDLAGEVPRLTGLAVALLITQRHIGTPVVGMAFALPIALGDAVHGAWLGVMHGAWFGVVSGDRLALHCLVELIVIAALLPLHDGALSRIRSPGRG